MQAEPSLWGDAWDQAVETKLAQPLAVIQPAPAAPAEPEPQWDSPNPMARIHGPGPEGTSCWTCKYRVSIMLAKSYSKCRFQPQGGRTTALKRAWPSCSKYEQGECSFYDGR